MKVNNSYCLIIDIKNTIFTLNIKVRQPQGKANKLFLTMKKPISRYVTANNQ
jgi:hypothetical protein